MYLKIVVQCVSGMIYKILRIYINDVRFVQDFHLPGTLVPSATKVIAVIESFM